MFVLKGMSAGIFILIVPILLGQVVVREKRRRDADFPKQYLLGMMAEFSLFWVLCVPMTLLQARLSTLTVLYTILLSMFCAFGIIKMWYNRRQPSYYRKKCRQIFLPESGYELVYIIIFLFLLAVQVYFAFHYQATISTYDDYDYVVEAVDMLHNNNLGGNSLYTGEVTGLVAKRALNSWITFTAYLSKMTGISVVVLDHTVIAVFYLLIAYMVYYWLAKKLFSDREIRWIFMDILAVAYIFGSYSHYTLSFRLNVALWQGKAILSVIIVPFLIGLLMEHFGRRYTAEDLFHLLLTTCAACSLTMMGAGYVLIIMVVTFVVYSVMNRRIWNLRYAACGCIAPAIQMIVYLLMR